MSSWSRIVPSKEQPVKKPRKENTISITVCVNFADKLLHSLECNSKFLKKLYVVTDPKDKASIDVCKKFPNVEVLLCPDAFKNNAKFNKSGLIKFAQVKITPLHREDWIIIIDADTIIPPNFWTEVIHFEQQFLLNTIYLMKRKIYESTEDLLAGKFKKAEIGCGFFQLYYDKTRMYSDYSESAAVCDILFQQLFRNQKTLNGYCIHLGICGLDWDGRISQLWS